MRGMDSLYQYIVPLAFAAIWALTSLFNRETQPLPPRPGRAPGPNGPRPSSPSSATVRPADWRPESMSTRPSGSGNPTSPGRSGGRKNDDIVILDSEPRKTTSSPGSRRGSRPRSSVQPTPRSNEPVTPRALSDSLGRHSNPSSSVQLLPQATSLNPLSLPPSPLLTNPADEAAKLQAGRALVTEQDSFSTMDIRKLLQNPSRLREGFIMGELLRPPVALRHGGLFPRRRT